MWAGCYVVLAQPRSYWQLLGEASCKSVFKAESFLISIHVISVMQILFEEGTALMWMWSPSFLPKTLGDGVGLGLLSQAQKQQDVLSPGALPTPHKPNLNTLGHPGTDTAVVRKPESTVCPPPPPYHLAFPVQFHWESAVFRSAIFLQVIRDWASVRALWISILR